MFTSMIKNCLDLVAPLYVLALQNEYLHSVVERMKPCLKTLSGCIYRYVIVSHKTSKDSFHVIELCSVDDGANTQESATQQTVWRSLSSGVNR